MRITVLVHVTQTGVQRQEDVSFSVGITLSMILESCTVKGSLRKCLQLAFDIGNVLAIHLLSVGHKSLWTLKPSKAKESNSPS